MPRIQIFHKIILQNCANFHRNKIDNIVSCQFENADTTCLAILGLSPTYITLISVGNSLLGIIGLLNDFVPCKRGF